jgi:hypothetical protein
MLIFIFIKKGLILTFAHVFLLSISDFFFGNHHDLPPFGYYNGLLHDKRVNAIRTGQYPSLVSDMALIEEDFVV